MNWIRSRRGLAAVAISLMLGLPAQAGLIANFNQGNNAERASLFIFGATGVTGTITSVDGINIGFVIDGSGVAEISLPNSVVLQTYGAVLGSSLVIDADGPISGHALNRESATSDMTYLHDTSSLGTEYNVLSYTGRFGGSQMSFTAREDGTTVTVTPSELMNGHAAGVAFNVTLNAGESYLLGTASNGDVSGSRITSDKPIAVFSGAKCTQIPTGTTACDHIVSQLPSVDNYSKSFVLAATTDVAQGGDLIRVLAAENDTEVKVNGVVVATLLAGQFYEADGVGDVLIEASKPVLVGQYMRGQNGGRGTGDPAFSFMPGTDQLLDEYVFATPVGGDSFVQNFLNIAILTADLGSLNLNGALVNPALFSVFGAYSVANLAIDIGSGFIKAANPFFASMSGFSSYDSYLTILGATFTPGASPPPPPPPPPNGDKVPEPAPLALLGLGLLGLFLSKKRRMQAHRD